MAAKAGPNLASLYTSCYLVPTFHAHATSFDLSRRLLKTDEGVTFGKSSVTEARDAVHLGHNLILQLVVLQDGYFNLGLEAAIRERFEAYVVIWDGAEQL
jgi:hypothetical protein